MVKEEAGSDLMTPPLAVLHQLGSALISQQELHKSRLAGAWFAADPENAISIL